MAQLENYLNGVPLNEDLAELMYGPGEPAKTSRTPAVFASRPLTESDFKALRQLQGYPGWEVLMMVLENVIERFRQGVIALSEADPIGNQAEVTAGWLEVKAWRRTRDALSGILDEVAAANREDTGNA